MLTLAGVLGFPRGRAGEGLGGCLSCSPRSGLPFSKKRSENTGFSCRFSCPPRSRRGSGTRRTWHVQNLTHPWWRQCVLPVQKGGRPNWPSARAETSKSVKTDKNDKNCVSGGLCACRPTNFKNAISTGIKSSFFHVFFLPSLLFLHFVAPFLSGEVHVELRRRFC